jgi:hypothetical protein
MHPDFHYHTYRKPMAWETALELFRESSFTRQLATLLVIDILIGFLYAMVPTTFSPIRGFLALIQFGFMAYTMTITAKKILEDY